MRVKYLSLLFIPALTLLTIYVGGETRSNTYDSNREMIVLRKIGHEILLNAGDSHSRILPIKKISDHEFRISFENPVAIITDSIVNTVTRIANENKLPEYIVNVVDCRKNENVYGFTIAAFNQRKSVIPCRGRALPKDCYYISLLLPTSKKSFSNLYYILASLAATAGLFFLLRSRSGKRTIPAPPPLQEEVVEKTGTIRLGKYLFHPDQQYLELDGEQTTLTNKEARLLSILAAAPNTIIERSLLQKEVWENEGVIVTRSLDMFISKLRKKMSGDPNIRIINTHGKGYKLEIS
jgi:hypothetical protein